jgi:hypothetical protein
VRQSRPSSATVSSGTRAPRQRAGTPGSCWMGSMKGLSQRGTRWCSPHRTCSRLSLRVGPFPRTHHALGRQRAGQREFCAATPKGTADTIHDPRSPLNPGNPTRSCEDAGCSREKFKCSTRVDRVALYLFCTSYSGFEWIWEVQALSIRPKSLIGAGSRGTNPTLSANLRSLLASFG